jgi:hypothetical protein
MRPAHLPDRAAELRYRLTDARAVCAQLNLAAGAKAQARGLLIRCPWHSERTPSCSIRQAPDGTLAVHCFGCDATGDVLSLVAAARQLDIRQDFPKVLQAACELAGVHLAALDVSTRHRGPSFHSTVAYPPSAEVAALWESCRPVIDDPHVATWLRSRALDPATAGDRLLVRALAVDQRLPSWAGVRGRSWAETGYRCILPMVDATGALRSLRARRVDEDGAPKAVAPTGFRIGGLVMADAFGRLLLETARSPDLWPADLPLRVLIAEGEPDFLTWGTRFSDADESAPAVFGIGSGSWTPAIAARVPDGARVVIRTHHDDAGERYAIDILESLRSRCTVVRGDAADCPLCPRYGWQRGDA